jgi:RNA polymerase sigma-70 factor, ECF subfamily
LFKCRSYTTFGLQSRAKPNLITTEKFVSTIKTDPDQALRMLYEQYYDMMCNQVYMILKDRTTSEDIVQDVLMGIWKKREDLNIVISIEGYLKRSCRNRALNYLRDNAIKWEDDEVLESQSAVGYDQAEQMDLDELNNKIQREIANLPDKCGIIFNLSRFEEMTYNEIAQQLDISSKTVENQISKALRILREKIYQKS